MLVIQMKLDPARGTEDLQTFARMCQAMGAIWYCVIGGAVYDYSPLGPQNFYWFSLAVGVVMICLGMIYPNASETHGIIGHTEPPTATESIQELTLA